MKIVILGAGQVGSSVAESLLSENNDITVIDTDAERLEALQVRLDLRTIVGNAILPSVLRSAGLEDADLLLALTPSDQVNLLACKMAQTLFTVPTRIARLRSLEFIEDPMLLSDEVFAVSHAFCPEQAITDYLIKLVDFPEALQVLAFAHGLVKLVAVRAAAGSPMVGKPISALREHLGADVDARIAALFRRDRPLPPKPDTVIKAGDEVFVLAAEAHIRKVFETNTFGVMAMVQAVIPQMRARRSGVIVNVTSSVTLAAMPLHRLPAEAVPYLNESRYCPSNKFHAFVDRRFGELEGGVKIARMRDWTARVSRAVRSEREG